MTLEQMNRAMVHVEKYITASMEPKFWSKDCGNELNVLDINIMYDRIRFATLHTKINLLIDLMHIKKQRMMQK